MRHVRTVITTAVITTAAIAAVAVPAGALAQAGAAQAPEISAQKTLTAGRAAPVTIPGTGLKKGMKLKSGQKLVYRTVDVGEGTTARFTLSCGARSTTRLRGLGLAEGVKVRFQLDGPTSYVGKRSVRLRANAPKDAASAGGSMYALCAR